MRIAYLSEALLPSMQANSIHVMRMTNAFAEQGNEAVLYARPGEGDPGAVHAWYGTRPAFAVELVSTGGVRGIGPWVRSTRVLRDLRSFRPDLVYARDPRSALLAAWLGRTTIYELHSVATGRRARIEQGLFRARRLRRLVFISAALRDDYGDAFVIPPRVDLMVAPDGADPVDPVTTAADLLARAGALRVGYAGQLYEGRGIDLIVRLAAVHPEHDFHVVGGDPESVGTWRSRAGENVTFHGNVKPADVAPYLAAFDVLLAPYQRRVATAGRSDDTSRWMSPLKIFEYMAQGKPIIASDLPVLKEVLEHRCTALLCRPDSVDEWSKALVGLTDADLRRALGDAARLRFEAGYSWAARAANVLEGIR